MNTLVSQIFDSSCPWEGLDIPQNRSTQRLGLVSTPQGQFLNGRLSRPSLVRFCSFVDREVLARFMSAVRCCSVWRVEGFGFAAI